MSDQLIIVLVVTIVVAAHLWLFLWIKFKMDEGIILKHFHDADKNSAFNSSEIAMLTDIAEHRVTVVCNKSKQFSNENNELTTESWRLNL